MAFSKENCAICGREISTGGAAKTSHMRSHVRNGEATESKHNDRLVFTPVSVIPEYVDPEPYVKLGDQPLAHQPDGVINITEALGKLKAIDPSGYYISSGEAVKKADKLVSDLYSLTVRARSFRDKLIEARATAVYLETQREDGMLIVKRKSPRKKR